MLRGTVRNRLQRAHGWCRETGQEAVFLEPSMRISLSWVQGSALLAAEELAPCQLCTLFTALGEGEGFLPICPLCLFLRQHQVSAGRMKGHGLHYGCNIILVMLTGRKNKGHLCHLLVQAWAHCLFLGPLSLDACAACSFSSGLQSTNSVLCLKCAVFRSLHKLKSCVSCILPHKQLQKKEA